MRGFTHVTIGSQENRSARESRGSSEVTDVALRSHAPEGSGSFGGDPFRGFLAEGEVMRDARAWWPVPAPCLVVILPVEGVTDVAALVLDSQWFIVCLFTSAAVIFAAFLLVIMTVMSLITSCSDIPKTSRQDERDPGCRRESDAICAVISVRPLRGPASRAR
jgi:hypothetical protein